MNIVEIEEAVSRIAESPFDAAEFPYQMMAAFGAPVATITRTRNGTQRQSDVDGAVMWRRKMHIAVCEPGAVEDTIAALERSSATERHREAISASLLMEQVLAPRFRFHARPPEDENGQPLGGDQPGFFHDEETGVTHITISGYAEPSTPEVQAILDQDLNDLVAAVCQDPRITGRAIADDATAPEVVNQVLIPRVIEERYPELGEDEVEQIRQRLVAGMAILAEAGNPDAQPPDDETDPDAGGSARFVNMVRRFVNVRDLSIDLIDQINPFQRAYEVLSKSLDAPTLSRIHGAIAEDRIQMTEEEAVALWPRIQTFRNENGREPSTASQSALEKRLGEALAWLRARKRERMAAGA